MIMPAEPSMIMPAEVRVSSDNVDTSIDNSFKTDPINTNSYVGLIRIYAWLVTTMITLMSRSSLVPWPFQDTSKMKRPDSKISYHETSLDLFLLCSCEVTICSLW